MGPLIAAALLVSSLRLASNPSNPLPAAWLIEAPAELLGQNGNYTALEALVLSRYNLLDLSTFCSSILLLHVCASWWLESRYAESTSTLIGERRSVPRSEALRTWYYIVFTLATSVGAVILKAMFHHCGFGFWQRA